MAAFKDQLNETAVQRIGASIARVRGDFAADDFVDATVPGLGALELKARVKHISDRLAEHLPADVPTALVVLVEALGPPGAPSGGDFWGPDASDERHTSGFLVWPLTQFVQDHGRGHVDASLSALEEMTRRFTAEFAVRPFVIEHEERALAAAMRWTRSPDQHLRRLASEGLRPRLPWGIQLKEYVRDPRPLLPVLEALKDDPEEYVRRSVANHLNDISKDHPDLVVEVGQRWLEEPTPERAWMIRHACRTLVKQGHPGALRLLGFAVPPALNVIGLQVAPVQLRLGETLIVSAELRSEAAVDQKIALDYVMTMPGARGRTREKVFKGSVRTLKAGEVASVAFKRPMKKVSTRRHYGGPHQVELLINGRRFGEARFELEV